MSRRVIVAAGVALVLAARFAGAVTPAPWHVVKDRKGSCQISVPADWTGDVSVANAPDKKAYAALHASRPTQTFDQVKATAQQVMKPTKTFQNDATRIWYSYAPIGNDKNATEWYFAVPGTPVCTGQVQFADPGLEATAKKIVDSLAPAK